MMKWPIHSDDEIQAVSRVLASSRTNYWTGEEGKEFEKEYAAFTGTRYAIAVMNGSVALEAALYALNIGPGDEVITTCRTFIASASAIVLRGATPIFADVDQDTQNITPLTIEPLITARTKAIIVVHLAGWPGDMPAIMALAEKYQLKVIEDCAQAHGAAIAGRRVGAWGDIGVFSFCQDKIITTGGEGGMVTTNEKALWEKIWAYKDHGKDYQAVYHRVHPLGFRWVHESFGTNWRMTEMQAAIGRLQLKKLPHWQVLRQRNAAILTNYFLTIPAFRVVVPPSHVQHAYYKYYVFLHLDKLKPDWNRHRLMATLQAQGIYCQTGSCGEIYRELAFVRANLHPPERRPHAMMLDNTSLMFQVDPSFSVTDMEKIARGVMEVMIMAQITSNYKTSTRTVDENLVE